MKKCLAFALILFALADARAQEKTKVPFKYANTFTIGAKLVQPVIFGGFNINGVYYAGNRFTLEYSHGGLLNYPDYTKTEEQKAQGAKISVPWTTGFGVGYRLTPTLDARMEFKAHRFKVEFDNTPVKTKYTTYTVGPGLYYRQYLGKKTGFNLELSSRYWFDVASSLPDDQFVYATQTDQVRSHEAVKMGLSFNLGIGYTFGRNKQ
ncbi:MAG: hypothetical protein H7Z75_07830 [Ferruginibacter sp.]|nr:hypothetical protein [Cytophagales bacterium]